MLLGWWDGILYAVAALFAGATLKLLAQMRWAQRLPPLDPRPPPRGGAGVRAPRVSAVIPARDEGKRIAETVRRLLAQKGVALEIIVVDDRSRDDTPEILRRLAAEDPRVRPLRIDVLPEGWLGKCHACHCGAAQATGDWILFTDADCWLKEDTLIRALEVAARDGVDHVCLTPGIAVQSFAAKAWHVAFLMTIVDWFARVNREPPRGFLGMGAFNLVRADAYRACGGYEALRLTVVDDVKLGLLLRRAGKRTRGFIGGDDAECHWGISLGHMIQVMEKNYFAAIDYRLSLVILTTVFAVVFWGIALIGPWTGRLSGIAAGLGLLSLGLPAAKLAERLHWPRWIGYLAPLAMLLMFYAIGRSTVLTLRQGGIYWRDTFYPLKILRAGNVQARFPWQEI